MLRNISLNVLSWVIVLCNAIVLSVLFLLYYLGLGNIWLLILIAALLLFASLWFTSYVLNLFVFNKVKLIYKTIRETKSSIRHVERESTKLNNLAEVENDVQQWSDGKKQELSDLRALEEYRRNYIGNISHELKTPLYSIQGYINTLLDGGLYDEKINLRYLKRASSNVERLRDIIEDLETINKLEYGQLLLEISVFDIKELCLEVIDDLSILAEEKGLLLDLKQGARSSFNVSADESKVRIVLANLIANAIKYGNKGGSVLVGIYDMVTHVLIEVSDNGIGIDAAHLKYVFDRFYRVDHGRGRKQGGSGLGLAIVKHLVEAHQQTVTARSTKDVGSTFSFTLDKAKA